MSPAEQMLLTLFTGFFTPEELEWLAASFAVPQPEKLSCQHCIALAKGITLKMASPLGMKYFSEIQERVEKGIDTDLADLEVIKTEQLAKAQSLLEKHQILLDLAQDPEQRKIREAELNQIYQLQANIKMQVESAKDKLLKVKEASQQHIGKLWSVLGQLPEMKN